jgi:hypothetical protein
MSITRLIGVAFVLSTLSVSLFGANRLVERGAPAPSHEWQGADYKTLLDLLQSGAVDLPTLADKDGSEIFARLVDTENLRFAQNRTLPLQTRLDDFMQMMGAANAITKIYIAKTGSGENLHRELAHQVGFSLHLTAALLDLVDELLPTIPKDDRHAVRMEGMKKVKSGAELVFRGAAVSLGERKIYTDQDVAHMLAAMSRTLPRMKTAFSDNFRTEASRTLTDRLAEATGEAEKATLRTIIDALK